MYPNGCYNDAPHELNEAITAAAIVLGWLELPEDETPPSEIWGHPEKMDDWAEYVKAKRKDPSAQPVTKNRDTSEGRIRNELLDDFLAED